MSAPPQVNLLLSPPGPGQTVVPFNTLPPVGRAAADSSLPVVEAQGVRATRTFVSVPKYVSGDTTKIVQVVGLNPDRRFLRIINNGPADVELWCDGQPIVGDINQPISRAELLYANGGGLEDTYRISAFFATATDLTGLVVLEG